MVFYQKKEYLKCNINSWFIKFKVTKKIKKNQPLQVNFDWHL
jgi:hypothetical protein